NGLLTKAFDKFSSTIPTTEFEKFCHNHNSWLDDYALFMSFRDEFDCKPWYNWPNHAARRDKKSLNRFAEKNRKKILYYKFVQFLFF
ncbi:4-alpha-glucanotransferase, partial [Candidatus Saccharibacteria bacterium]|nr:4-alpha-glucanotransferase [Candidatus Saccharibacteria bacterium]